MGKLENPFKPGAGHYPPHLAGRHREIQKCKTLFEQETILRNIILTGLRGVGKTVLLRAVKPIALEMGWLWCGTDMSESASVSEETLATRLLTDLSLVTSSIPVKEMEVPVGFSKPISIEKKFGFEELSEVFHSTPGLVSDKLKTALSVVWEIIKSGGNFRGLIFAYDEVQTMEDHTKRDQYPLSVLLDLFQSLQSRGTPFMLLLTGLPTLLPKLVATRTYSERMFESIFLERLNRSDSKEAIERPIEQVDSPVRFTPESVERIINLSSGYPYFIQFICREVFDLFIQQQEAGIEIPSVPADEILRKLDTDFFSGRWAHLTDRQRDLLVVIASLEGSGREFTVQEVALKSEEMLENSFGGSQITQMLGLLSNKGIVYRNRHGRYSFAVPLFDRFINRQMKESDILP